jgi:hypothetical protein
LFLSIKYTFDHSIIVNLDIILSQLNIIVEIREIILTGRIFCYDSSIGTMPRRKGDYCQMSEERFFLYDEKENTEVRFVSFMGDASRYDLAILKTNKYYGKTIVMDLQGNRFSITGEDDLREEGYLEHIFNLTEIEAEELREFLSEII